MASDNATPRIEWKDGLLGGKPYLGIDVVMPLDVTPEMIKAAYDRKQYIMELEAARIDAAFPKPPNSDEWPWTPAVVERLPVGVIEVYMTKDEAAKVPFPISKKFSTIDTSDGMTMGEVFHQNPELITNWFIPEICAGETKPGMTMKLAHAAAKVLTDQSDFA